MLPLISALCKYRVLLCMERRGGVCSYSLCPHGVPPQEGCEGQSLELFEGSIIPVSEG